MEATTHPDRLAPELLIAAATDQHDIPLYVWRPEGIPQAVVHMCHGMAEHGGRYDELAQHLLEQGIACVAHDHRGHGRNLDQGPPGHFADRGGWEKVLSDVDVVQQWIKRSFSRVPVFLLGHSMGSFIVQSYLVNTPQAPALAGLILSGSNFDSNLRLRLTRPVISAIRLMAGPSGYSDTLTKMTFGTFARSVPDAKTEYDWLSNDETEVQRYINDEQCGFHCSVQLWHDLTGALIQINQASNLKRISASLPVYILAGDRDPVGQLGKGPRLLAEAYRKTGHDQVTLRIYPGLRHEAFHETGRAQVFTDLSDWLMNTLAQKH